jgi:hypothetical protein
MDDLSRREFFRIPGKEAFRLLAKLADGRLESLFGLDVLDPGTAEEAGLALGKKGRRTWPGYKENR